MIYKINSYWGEGKRDEGFQVEDSNPDVYLGCFFSNCLRYDGLVRDENGTVIGVKLFHKEDQGYCSASFIGAPEGEFVLNIGESIRFWHSFTCTDDDGYPDDDEYEVYVEFVEGE